MLIRSLLDLAFVQQCRAHLSEVQVRSPAGSSILAVPLGADAFADGFAGALAVDSRLTGLAAELLGGPVRCFGCTYLVKAARSGPAALWHQDGHPWRTRLGIDRAVTIWVALDHMGADNGGLTMLAGSHTRPARPLEVVAGGGGMFGGGIDPGPLDGGNVRLLTMAPGDASAHHSNLIHSSGPNGSPAPRRALAVRFRGD